MLNPCSAASLSRGVELHQEWDPSLTIDAFAMRASSVAATRASPRGKIVGCRLGGQLCLLRRRFQY